MNDLLSLFDEIETKPVNMIPETDRMIVDNYWNLFMEKFNGLRAMWAEFVERQIQYKRQVQNQLFELYIKSFLFSCMGREFGSFRLYVQI